eukprot:gb/GECH01012226.1/.p1 GENE.gb/GECH01012226.1/~~gb/GECH01012226.1/.p1  ORF type:complete len:193 (+),score=41.21 gb/GECH01012226.1/:1-579(+)
MTLRPLIICGPSGVGKGTLVKFLRERHPSNFGFSVSHTTRDPRPGEKHGVNYYFVSRKEFERSISNSDFIEHANVHGNLYGTSFKAVEEVSATGIICILDIDVQGARQVKRSSLNPLSVFVNPPSFQELENRLRGRKTESEEKIEERLANAKSELEAANEDGLFDYQITNDEINECINRLEEIISKEIYPLS